jgi:hypothetical protein
MNDAYDYMRAALNRKPVLDAVDMPKELIGAADYAEKDIKLKAVASIYEWVETDNLGEGETNADRLMALIVGIADADKNGEITDDEAVVLDIALNAAADYLVSIGVDEEDVSLLLNDWDSDAADRVMELVASTLPDSEEDAMDKMDDFVFGEKDQEPVLDAVYKKTAAIRNGKKVLLKKRISGTVRLSGAQKVAIKKMQRKSHSAGAQIKRMKSMMKRKKMNIKPR